MNGVHAADRAIRAAMLSVACGLALLCAGLTAGCAATARPTAHASPVAARHAPSPFCAYQIATPTAAETAAINRYWTPLARSAVRFVSRGKMLVPVPKRDLTPAQRRALARAEWAWRTFSPKPKLVCEPVPAGRGAGRAVAVTVPR